MKGRFTSREYSQKVYFQKDIFDTWHDVTRSL